MRPFEMAEARRGVACPPSRFGVGELSIDRPADLIGEAQPVVAIDAFGEKPPSEIDARHRVNAAAEDGPPLRHARIGHYMAVHGIERRVTKQADDNDPEIGAKTDDRG